MLEKILKYAFALTGALTGISLVRFIMIQSGRKEYLGTLYGIGLITVVAVILGVGMFFLGDKVIALSVGFVDKIEDSIQKTTLYELMMGAVGLIAGLIIANLISIPIVKIELIGVPLSIIINVLFGICGIYFTVIKRNENIFDGALSRKKTAKSNGIKLLDTSVIIDGRILDLSRTGFLEGELVIPGFVLEELRHLADSSDDVTRAKGRRGLDVLNMLKSDAKFPITIDNTEGDSQVEVDEQLLSRAKEIGAKIITNDYNLGKVAKIRGIDVLNINDLANSMKPIAVSGEEMTIRIVKEGKESGQGIGYLDDGTMVVVEQAYKYKGQLVDLVVVSVLQTSAGRMIFGKLKNAHFSLANSAFE
ncbi:MAG TPA: PIN/TRAM domain-containing protein [Clostridiaceae bacterium]|nr:PIN/TRAM domain-containing protein [Clostridiaceae bacterium]